MITLEQFRLMIPTNKEPEVWFDIAVGMLEKYEINTQNRIAGFMAQCGHESRDFHVLEENLNYSENRLLELFPRYFGPPPKRNPRDYARNPRKLANYIYMDEFRPISHRLGNVHRGDGWIFVGGGIIQITGRHNFTRFGRSLGITPEEAADYVRSKRGAFESACWFWKTKNLNTFADNDDIDGMSRRVNGGNIGLQDRRNRYNRNKQILTSISSRTRDSSTNSSSAVNNESQQSENSNRSFFSRIWPFS